MIVPAIAAVFIPAAAGYLAAAAVLKNKAGFLERAGLAFPLGAGFLALLMFYIGLLRIPFSLYSVLVPLASASTYLVYFLNKSDIKFLNFSDGFIREFKEEGPLKQATAVILFGWIILKIGSLFFVTATLPVWSPDSWWNWSTRAFVFFNDKGLYLHHDDFFAASVGHYAYPPHNPLMQVWQAMMMGGFDRVLVKLWVPAYTASAALFLYAIARRHAGRLVSGVMVLFFLSSPLMTVHSTEPYADMALGVYIMFAVGAFWMLTRGEREYALLCGLLSAQALFVKLEGMVFVPLLAGVFIFRFLKERQYRISPGLPARYFAPFLLLLPYVLFKLYYHIPFSHQYSPYSRPETAAASGGISFHKESLALIYQYLLHVVDNFNVLPFLAPVLPVVFVISGAHRHKTAGPLYYAAAPVLLYMLAFMTLYIFHDTYADSLSDGYAFYRNFMTYYPALYFIICAALSEIYTHLTVAPKMHNTPELT